MVSSARQAIVCILLIFATAVYVRPQSVTEKGPTASISGKVTVKGKGVPGVGVSLTLVEPNSSYTTRNKGVTDDEGNYRITNVSPGQYTVMIAAPAFAPAEGLSNYKTILINKGETVENVDFGLVPGGVITGRVTDSDGRPVIEEEISILPLHMESPQMFNLRGRGRTDDRGIYRVFGLPPGSYRVSAGQGGDGNFSSGWEGRYKRTFHPDATEASQATVIELKEGGEVTNVDITLGRAVVKYFASGRIIDGDTGRPVPNVSYGVHMFINPHSEASLTTGAVSTSEGEFRLNDLAPGKYAVFLEPPPNSEWRADYLRFEVSDHAVTDLVVKTSRGASASGVVVVEGTNDKAIYAKGRVHAFVASESSVRSSSQTALINPDGSFRVAGLPPGLLNLQFSGGDRWRVVRVERDGVLYPRIEIKEAEQITGLRLVVNYANATIRGVIKSDKGPLPPNAHFNVHLTKLGEDDGQYSANFNDSLQVDTRGQFFAEGLLPGTYEVTAFYMSDVRTEWRQTKQQVVVANGVVTNVTLTIDPNAPLPGRP
jgi:hypothetical protein